MVCAISTENSSLYAFDAPIWDQCQAVWQLDVLRLLSQDLEIHRDASKCPSKSYVATLSSFQRLIDADLAALISVPRVLGSAWPLRYEWKRKRNTARNPSAASAVSVQFEPRCLCPEVDKLYANIFSPDTTISIPCLPLLRSQLRTPCVDSLGCEPCCSWVQVTMGQMNTFGHMRT